MLNLLASISEFEHDLLKERSKFGIAHARSKGTKSDKAIGRPALGNKHLVLKQSSERCSIRQVAKDLGISKTTIANIKASATPISELGALLV